MDFFRNLSGHQKKYSNNGNSSSIDKASLSTALSELNDLIYVLKSTSNPPVILVKMLPDLHSFLKTLADNEAEIANRAATAATVLNVTLPTFPTQSNQIPLPTAGKPRSVIEIYKDAASLYIRRASKNVTSLVVEIKKMLISVQQNSSSSKIQRTLNVNQLHLSVLFHEMLTFFPHHSEEQSQQHSVQWKFKCAKQEAHIWWTSHFGDWYLVDWEEFTGKFCDKFCLSSSVQESIIRTLNFARTDYLSKYVFDLFTRLFSPWNKLVEVWSTLSKHPGYMGLATYEEARECLAPYMMKPGSYIFRFSSTKFGFWSIAYVKESGSISQVLLKDRTIVEALTQGMRKRMYVYPHGETINPNVSHLTETATLLHLEDVYGFNNCGGEHQEEMDASSAVVGGGAAGEEDAEWSKMCKICFSKEKDTQMEPCLHCMCRACLNEWMNRGDTCPWCREPIRSIRRVVATLNKRKYDAQSSATQSPTFNRASENSDSTNLSNQNSPTQIRAGSRRDNVPLPAPPSTDNNQDVVETVKDNYVPPLPPRTSMHILPSTK